MTPDLHLDPAALQASSSAVEAVLPALRRAALDPADLDALAALPGGPAVVAEHDRLLAAAGRARRELSDLLDALRAVLAAVESADHAAVRAITGVRP